MKLLVFITIILFFSGCRSEPKVERDAYGSIIREDPFVEDKLYKKKAEDARRSDVYGASTLSDHCEKVNIGEGLTFITKCHYEFLMRLKLQCEFPQATGVAFHLPVRFKELQVNILNVDKTIFKDSKRFPTKVTTNQDGVLDFSFATSGILKDYQIEISNSKFKVTVSSVKLGDPILVPESFCSKNVGKLYPNHRHLFRQEGFE